MEIDADSPLENPTEDLLGYASFAEQLAKSLLQMPIDGVVAAIHGSWGLGKTSTLNFIKHYLQEPAESSAIVVNFNPWWFSGQEDLTLRFFAALKEAINALGKTDVAELLLDFAEIASAANVPWWLKASSVAMDQIKKKCIEEYSSIDQKRKGLEKALRTQKNKIIIIIDDIDRLTSEEIRQIFKLIKSVANLPNVIYLLAFDEIVVSRSLEGAQSIPGREYLKKIVQIPFELPLPEKSKVANFLFKRLDSLLTNLPERRFDQERWHSIYLKGIQYYINTPRDAIRLANSLNVTYGCVLNEVNPVDFFAIETIRVFAPDTYDLIRKNPFLFTGHSLNNQESKFNLQLLPNECSKQNSALKSILTELFPKLKTVEYGSDWLVTWRKDLRICNPDCFSIYFRLTIPEGETSNADIQHLLLLTKNPKSLAEFFIHQSKQNGVDGHSRLHSLLRRLADHVDEDLQEVDIPSLINAFFLAGDSLLSPQDQKQSFWDPYGSADSVYWIMSSILIRLPQNKRQEILRQSIEATNEGVSLVFLILYRLKQDLHNSTKTEREEYTPLISNYEGLNPLFHLAIEKPLQAAKDSSLINTPFLPCVLSGWKEYGSEEDVQEWLDQILKDDQKLLLLIRSFLQKAFVFNPFTKFCHTPQSFPLDYFSKFVDLKKVSDRLKHLQREGNLSEIDNSTLACFFEAYSAKNREKIEGNPY